MDPKQRYQLLLLLSANPDYVGKDDDEKAAIKEIKAELKAAGDAAKGVEADVKKEAAELTKTLVETVKELTQAALKEAKNAEPDRTKLQDDPKQSPEVKAFLKKFDEDTEAKLARMTKKEAKQFKRAARFGAFVQALYKKDGVALSALAEGTDELGGYLVPDEFRADLIEHMLQTDAIRNYATVIPMEGKLLEIPKLTSDVQVSWGTENNAIATTTAKFGNLQLTPFRMNAIIYTSREMFDDSAISIMEVLRRRFRDRIADEENKVFITGNGTTRPKGIDQETFTTVNAGLGLSPDHITKAYWKLPRNYRRTCRWLINSRTIAELEVAKDTTNNYLYPTLQNEVPTLKGRPILVDDYVPSTKIFLGDLSYYYIGDRQQVTMEITTEGGNTWQQHQVGLKVIERVDGEVALTQAFVEISNTGVS